MATMVTATTTTDREAPIEVKTLIEVAGMEVVTLVGEAATTHGHPTSSTITSLRYMDTHSGR